MGKQNGSFAASNKDNAVILSGTPVESKDLGTNYVAN